MKMRKIILFCSVMLALGALLSCDGGGGGFDEADGILRPDEVYYWPQLEPVMAKYTAIDTSNVGKKAYMISYNMSLESLPYTRSGAAMLEHSASRSQAVSYSARLQSDNDDDELLPVCAPSVNSNREKDPMQLIRDIERRADSAARAAAGGAGRNAMAKSASSAIAPSKFDSAREGSTETAWVLDGNGLLANEENQVQKGFTLRVSGTLCNVWVGTADTVNVTDDFLRSLADSFDSTFPVEMKIFGSREIMDNSGTYISTPEKVNIFVYDFYGKDITESRVVGFFYSLDLYTQEALSVYKTNETQCFYLDSRAVTKSGNGMSLIVHEGQHMLGCINKKLNKGLNFNRSKWNTEMLSVMSQDLLAEYIGTADLKKAYGFYVDSFAQMTWRGFYNWDDALYSYGAAYTFAAYLARQYGGARAVSFIKELAGNGGIDRDCVENAIRAFGSADKFENAIAGWGWYLLDSTFGEVHENVGGSDFVMHTLKAQLAIADNPADGIHASVQPLSPYSFYVVDLGRVLRGDRIKAKMTDNGAGVRMYVCYK